MATVNDLVYIDSTGYHYSDYPTFLEWVQAEYRGIYGADVYLGVDSQDGQFLAVLAQSFFDLAAVGASVYNSFSPISAQGIGLSRVVKINGIRRREPTRSTVDLDVGGTDGTVITDGVAEDILGQKWDLPTPVTIPGSGTVTVTATAQELGALNAQSDTVNRIFTPTRGWQTVNNPSAATAGEPVETDAELRIRQSESTANPSLTVLDGSIGAVFNVEGVTNVRGYENDSNITDGNGIPAHSIAMIVAGGDAVDIAETIALHKTPGAGTAGSTSEIVYDAHGMPLTIRFYRPTLVTITCEVVLTTNEAWTADYEDLIKASIAEHVNGIGIGNEVLITRFYAPAYLSGTLPGQSYDIVSLEIGKDLDPVSDVNIPIDFDELPMCDPETDVTITT